MIQKAMMERILKQFSGFQIWGKQVEVDIKEHVITEINYRSCDMTKLILTMTDISISSDGMN